MKARFSVSTALKTGGDLGIENISSPMLMVAKFSGIRLSEDFQPLVDTAKTRITSALRNRFSGKLGQAVVVSLEDCQQENLVFVGLGKADQFGCASLRAMTRAVVKKAVASGVSRLTIPIVPKRMAGPTLNSTAYIIKCVAQDVLEETPGDGTLNIELVCVPQGKNSIQRGLRRQRRERPCDPCKTNARKRR